MRRGLVRESGSWGTRESKGEWGGGVRRGGGGGGGRLRWRFVYCVFPVLLPLSMCAYRLKSMAGLEIRGPQGIKAEILTLFFIPTYIQEYAMNKVILLSLFGFLINCLCSVP
jgi:hypothetical protein